MKAGSGLVTGRQAQPELAGQAVRVALSRAGLERADSVILFLTRDFARHPQAAIVEAARAAGSLSIGGSTAFGLFTETGWQIDQPAAAAMVFGSSTSHTKATSPCLSFSAHSRLPYDWSDDQPRAGFLDTEGATWSHGRIADNGCAEFQLPAGIYHQALSSGLRALGEPLPVDEQRGYELLRIGGQRAVDSLLRVLPPEMRPNPPWHHIALLRDAGQPAISILSANADGSLTVADNIEHDTALTWAMRQPLAAEGQMREALASTASRNPAPDFALMFSCIGRGPLFYGNDDRDLQLFRENFPHTPLIGAYGTSQIAPCAGHNKLFHNSALTLLHESTHAV